MGISRHPGEFIENCVDGHNVLSLECVYICIGVCVCVSAVTLYEFDTKILLTIIFIIFQTKNIILNFLLYRIYSEEIIIINTISLQSYCN